MHYQHEGQRLLDAIFWMGALVALLLIVKFCSPPAQAADGPDCRWQVCLVDKPEECFVGEGSYQEAARFLEKVLGDPMFGPPRTNCKIGKEPSRVRAS